MNDKSRGVLIRTSVQLLKAFSSYDEPFTARQVSLSSGVGLRRVYRWIKVMKEEGLLLEVDYFRGGSAPSRYLLRKDLLDGASERSVNKKPEGYPPRSMFLQGEMQNTETGETCAMERLVFFNEATMSTVIRIIEVKSFHFPGNQFQLWVSGEALDSLGNIWTLELDFFPKDQQTVDLLLSEMQENSFHSVKGRYCMEEGQITIYAPEHWEIKASTAIYDLEELKEVFAFNGKESFSKEESSGGKKKVW